jgi:hypothetical protein
MNRHERRRAAATGKRSDVAWSSFREGSAYRSRLADERGPGAVRAMAERMAGDEDPGPLVGLVLDCDDVAAHSMRSQLGNAAETSKGVVVGSCTLDAAVDFLATWNTSVEAGDRDALRAQLADDEDHVHVLVVAGGGSCLYRFHLPDDDQGDEPGRVLS